MKKLFFLLLTSIIGVASADNLNSNSSSNGLVVIKQDCKYYAQGVKDNLQGKKVQGVTISYSKNYSNLAQICTKQIRELMPDLKFESQIVTTDTMPTVSYMIQR